MNKHKLMLDILKDTRDYYDADPDNRRSISKDGECLYTWGDTHCAVGRYLKEEYQTETWSSNNESVNDLCENSDEAWDIDWAVRDEVKGIDPDFWRDLQDFHDNRHNWITEDTFFPPGDEKDNLPVGISDEGKKHYVGIQDRIADGVYDG
jgi:hypothetical protein